jgi:hypothetical protein
MASKTEEAPEMALREPRNAVQAGTLNSLPNTKAKRPNQRAALSVVGEIPKADCSQLRVAISEWRGERKIELRECSRVFGSIFFPTGVPVTIPIDKLPELIALLQKVRP